MRPCYGRVSSNPSELNRLLLRHDRGAVAMARSQAPNSASAQFYIALKPLPELDGRYAVFGRVTEGMDVVDAIRQGIASPRLPWTDLIVSELRPEPGCRSETP